MGRQVRGWRVIVPYIELFCWTHPFSVWSASAATPNCDVTWRAFNDWLLDQPLTVFTQDDENYSQTTMTYSSIPVTVIFNNNYVTSIREFVVILNGGLFF